MDGRKRIQFSVGNLMLMMAPLGGVFAVVSQTSETSWGVWLCTALLGGALAVGALVSGWTGMGRVLLWLGVASLYAYVVAGVVIMWSGFAQALVGAAGRPLQMWSVCGALLLLGVGMVIGARKGGARRGVDMGVWLVIFSGLGVMVVCVATIWIRARMGW